MDPDQTLLGPVLVAGTFAVIAVIELMLPLRRARRPKARRWFTNLTLFAIDTLAVRLLLPVAMVGAAAWAHAHGWGLFNHLAAPSWLAFALSLIALDLALWVQHWATHRAAWLWRLHRVHHSDVDFDVSTAARFHPGEIVLSMLWKMAVVALLGAPIAAVAVFETGFVLAALITHANLALPGRFDHIMRLALVTPDMHRIHHSALPAETDSNYGTFLALWDRLFGTYRGTARDPQASMTIGLAQWQDDRPARLGFSLWLPFGRR